MPLELVTPRPEHVPDLARILYEAFAALHDRHATPYDIPSREWATRAMSMLVVAPDHAGVAAVLDGRVVGSNFVALADPVGGVGPITVDPTCQSRGVGRRLMQGVVDLARDRGVTRLRLVQEAINTTSLSLYTSLGWDWRDSAAILDFAPARQHDETVRPLAPADLDAVERLSMDHYRSSRRNEVAGALAAGRPAFLRERRGAASGYFVPGFFGHGMADSMDDALTLITQAARRAPKDQSRFFCPLSQAELFRAALAAGCRVIKVMSYMSLGPYDPPRAVWMPSIAC